jgi:excisionase family DNA binding protein
LAQQTSNSRNSSVVPPRQTFIDAASAAFEPLLSDEQAARLLGGLHVKTLQRMARDGEIPAFRVGRYWRYRASQLEVWLQARSGINSQSQPDRVN